MFSKDGLLNLWTLWIRNKELDEEYTNHIAIKQMRLAAWGMIIYTFYLLDSALKSAVVFGA
jgi:hypothetical protein